MFESCEMKLEPLAQVQVGQLKLEAVASRQMCIIPDAPLDPWGYAARLRVTNTGSTPVQLSHGDGALGQNAFGLLEITEHLHELRPTKIVPEDTRGPIDPDQAITTDLSLSPGASHEVIGAPTYILAPIQASVAGKSIAGGSVPEEDRYVRNFELEFNVWLVQGGQDLTTQLRIPLTVMVKPPENQ